MPDDFGTAFELVPYGKNKTNGVGAQCVGTNVWAGCVRRNAPDTTKQVVFTAVNSMWPIGVIHLPILIYLIPFLLPTPDRAATDTAPVGDDANW